MIRVRQIKVPINSDQNFLLDKITKKLKISKDEINNFKISKKSIDARKSDINYVYELDINLKDENKVLKKNLKDVVKAPTTKYTFNICGTKALKNRPVIIGSGPAGLFAAYLLASNGYKPIVFERGQQIDERIKSVDKFWSNGVFNPNSNVQFGEGGAGTFSDGKLNTSTKDKFNRGKFVLNTFVKHGALEEILYINKPHIGTDLLRGVIKNIRNSIITLGGDFYYESCLQDIHVSEGRIKSVKVENKIYDTDVLILAIGHSSRDTFKMLLDNGLEIKPKPFAVGVRVQHPQKMINENQYGKNNFNLPSASYKLTYKATNGRGVYSFCMCPGGFVVNASSEEEKLVINGMSNHSRDEENANSAIVVTVSPDDYGYNPLDGVIFQQNLEKLAFEKGNGKIPVQLLSDYMSHKKSSSFKNINPVFKGDYCFSDLNEIFPEYINDSIKEAMLFFNKKISGFSNDDVILAAVESRTSSPIKMTRDENLVSNIKGIYPCGEGSGYAGGIMTSAIDGIKVAEEIAKIYRPLN